MDPHHRWWRYFAGVLLFCLPVAASAQSPLIQEVVDRIDRDSLVTTVRVLTGETGSTHEGMSDTIYSRSYQDGTHGLATDYLKSKLESYGLSTRLQPYTLWYDSGTNVLAEQRGTVTPGRMYILCAHYDSYSGTPGIAPGADDNASGCAAVLEAARILSRYKTASTVLYALWDQEEGGRIGSLAYLKDSLDRQDTILGAVNLDMIGFEGNGDSLMEIHAQNVSNSGKLADTAALVQRLYGIGLKTHVYYPTGNGQSDHGSFWMLGYGAVFITEALRNNDDNPFYHMVTDRIQAFNLPYFHQMGRLAAGTIALLADVQSTASVPRSDPLAKAFFLGQNYPNPFNPVTTIKYTVGGAGGRRSGDSGLGARVKLAVYDLLGREVAVLVDEQKAPGSYEVRFSANGACPPSVGRGSASGGDGNGLASGVYFYRLTAGEFLQTRKLVLLH